MRRATKSDHQVEKATIPREVDSRGALQSI